MSWENLRIFGNKNRIVLVTGAAWIFVQGISLSYPNVRFWDDYQYYATNKVNLPRSVVPNPGRDLIDGMMLSIWPGLFRVLTFILLPVCSLLFYKILTAGDSPIGASESKMVASAFLLWFPSTYSIMVSMTLFNYTLALTVFLVGWLAIISKKWYSRWLIAPISIAISFRLPSLIPFLIFPVLHTLWLGRTTRRTFAERAFLAALITGTALSYFPILTRLGYTFQDNYNEVLPSRFLKGLLVLLLATCISAWLLFQIIRRKSEKSVSLNLSIAISSLMFGVAAFPYLITGHLTDISSVLAPLIPREGGYGGRHLVLFAFPLSILTSAFLQSVRPKFSRRVSQVLLGSLTLLGLSNSIEWKVDAIRQNAVIRALSQMPEISSIRYFYLDDGLSELNAKGRDVRSYEKEGWIRMAGGQKGVQHLVPATSQCNIVVPGFEISLRSSNLSRIQMLLSQDLTVEVSATEISLCGTNQS